jgi:uncharacterized membrane protein YcaP (DUF421 family)
MRLLSQLFGESGQPLDALQVSLRAVVIFAAALFVFRVANRRILGRFAAFDTVLLVVLGSVLSRAINGTASLWPTLAGVAVLIAMHWCLAAASFRWPSFGRLVKGEPRVLAESGKLCRDELRRTHISPDDLIEELRCEAGTEDLARVESLRLECNGRVSVIERSGNGSGDSAS